LGRFPSGGGKKNKNLVVNLLCLAIEKTATDGKTLAWGGGGGGDIPTKKKKKKKKNHTGPPGLGEQPARKFGGVCSNPLTRVVFVLVWVGAH